MIFLNSVMFSLSIEYKSYLYSIEIYRGLFLVAIHDFHLSSYRLDIYIGERKAYAYKE